MESSSKTSINILLVVAIVLMSASVITTYINKTKVVPQAEETKKLASTSTPTVSIQITETPTPSSSSSQVVSPNATSSTSTTSPISILEKKWLWVSTVTKNKPAITPKKVDTFSITFNKNDTLSGATDCNKIMGGYKLSTTTISFSPLAMTRMFCENSQETEFSSPLQGIKNYSVDKNNILIITDGTTTMTFK